METRLKLLTYLKEIHHKIDTQENLNNNLKMILETSKNLINYDYCGIFTKNEKDDKLYPFFLLPKNLFDLTFSEYEFLDFIFNNETSFISNNVLNEKGVKYNYLTVSKDENSFIGTPLIFNKNKIKGVIFALSKKANTFSEDDLIILENFAGLIVTIINCYETRKKTISAMRQIDRKLYSEIRDTKRVMDKIVQCAIEITGADHGCLLRYDSINKQLECRYPTDCKKCNKDKERKCTFQKVSSLYDFIRENFSNPLILTGDRISESISRSFRPQFRKDEFYVYSPIKYWSFLDIQLLFHLNNIPFNKLYEKGFYRIGCKVCPFIDSFEKLILSFLLK